MVLAGAPRSTSRTELNTNQIRGFWAAWGGWALDGMDASIYAVVLVPALRDLLPRSGIAATPANIGYMSGALKHFFDGIYYPCLEATRGRPYALYVHGNSDTTGAVRAVESITTGLSWRRARPPLSVLGPPSAADLEACWELGAVMAAGLAG